MAQLSPTDMLLQQFHSPGMSDQIPIHASILLDF